MNKSRAECFKHSENTQSIQPTNSKLLGDKQIIAVSYKDEVYFNRYNWLWYVNGIGYDSKKYVIRLDKTKDLKCELKALINIDRLKKKLITHFNNIDRIRYLSGDNKLLKQRQINKGKKVIRNYLTNLKADANFTLESIEKQLILWYKGTYANAKRVVVL
jgi:hypothetical protein